MDFIDCFTWFVLSLDAAVLSVAIGWYLAESGRRKVPYLRNLSGDPRIFDPHVRINGRWVPLDHLLSGAPSVPQRAWFGPRH